MLAGEVGPKSRIARPSEPWSNRVNSPSPLERRNPASVPCTGCWLSADDLPPKKREKGFATCRRYYLYPLVVEAGAAGSGEEDGVVTGVTGVEVACPACCSRFAVWSLLMSIPPLKYAPSSMTIRCVTMSPASTADLLR